MLEKVRLIIVFLALIFCFGYGLAYSEDMPAASGMQTKTVAVNKDGTTDVAYYSDGEYITKTETDTKENKVAERQQVLEYLNKSEFIMKSVNEKIAEKQILLAQASMTKNMENMRAITTEMRDIFAEHKQQFLTLSVPPNCEELYSVTLKWYQLQEDIHNELIKGNIQQSKLLTQQLIACFDKIRQESNRLIQYYEQ